MSNFVTIKDKDGVTLGQLPVSSEGGRLRNIRYITSTQAYEKPSWLKFVIVRVVGGGGGGAGCPATSTGQQALGGNGCGAGYTQKLIPAALLAESETVTVGAGGLGGEAGANAGATGGTSSFGSHCSASGGGGGGSQVAAANTGTLQATSGSAGAGSGGDINIRGTKPGRSTLINGISFYPVSGAAPMFGAPQSTSSASGNGDNGLAYGSGGAGGQNSAASQPARTGGNGSPGIVIIEEYE